MVFFSGPENSKVREDSSSLEIFIFFD